MPSSRRSFLAAAASAAAWPRGLTASEAVRGSSFDPWVEVHAGHLRHSVTEVHRRVGGRPILAVVKNNGYGLGLVEAARLLEPLPAVAGFAVVKLQEALALRAAGTAKPVLLMGPLEDQELEEAATRNITPMVYTPIGSLLDRVAARLGRPVPIHLCVDTGLGRVGVPWREAGRVVRDLAGRKSLRVEGTMMTFAEHPELDREQLRRFGEVCQSMEAAGIPPGRRHAASSFGVFQHADSFLDMVRPGMALYGIYPEPEFRRAGLADLRPALALKARVAYVKALRAGDTAGYGRAYVAQRDVWVATLPVGHADGWPRAAAQGASVRIGAALYPVIATVSASHCIVEVGPEPRVRGGEVATLFDWQEGSRPEDVAAACRTSVYDLAMHLSPLLPRHLV